MKSYNAITFEVINLFLLAKRRAYIRRGVLKTGGGGFNMGFYLKW